MEIPIEEDFYDFQVTDSSTYGMVLFLILLTIQWFGFHSHTE